MKKYVLLEPTVYEALTQHTAETGRSIKFCASQAVRQWLEREGVAIPQKPQPQAKAAA